MDPFCREFGARRRHSPEPRLQCVRGMCVTVGTVVELLAAGRSSEEILKAYPYLEASDILEALAYAAWRAEEQEVPLVKP